MSNLSFLEMAVTVVTAVIASSGFWAYLQKRAEKKDVKTRVLIGLAHDRIMVLGAHYIERGFITPDEYENLNDYLYEPYRSMGGNGSAKLMMDKVSKLEVKPLTAEFE